MLRYCRHVSGTDESVFFGTVTVSDGVPTAHCEIVTGIGPMPPRSDRALRHARARGWDPRRPRALASPARGPERTPRRRHRGRRRGRVQAASPTRGGGTPWSCGRRVNGSGDWRARTREGNARGAGARRATPGMRPRSRRARGGAAASGEGATLGSSLGTLWDRSGRAPIRIWRDLTKGLTGASRGPVLLA